MEGFTMFVWLVCFLVVAPVGVIILILYLSYQKSTYREITENSFFATTKDLGKYGEYLIYNYLKKYEEDGGKFLFNLYIPKDNGETTEIDVLLISKKGIFIFESKNYGGWIFGNEHQQMWTQTLPARRGRSHKEQFYNPIMQNRTHKKYIKNIVGEQVPMFSIIVFSNRCTLKDITITSTDVNVIKRNEIAPLIESAYRHIPNDVLSEAEVNDIYIKLYPYTQVSEQTKVEHIANIRNNNKCPLCNGELIMRTAKRGAKSGRNFYGCSNYPKCKFTRDV